MNMVQEEDIFADKTDTVKALENLLMPDYFYKIITPDLAENEDFIECFKGLPLFTKELKISNLNDKSMERVRDLNQKIILYWKFAIFDYALQLLAKRDLLLSSSSSYGMAERKLQHTTKLTSVETQFQDKPSRLRDKMIGRR